MIKVIIVQYVRKRMSVLYVSLDPKYVYMNID